MYVNLRSFPRIRASSQHLIFVTAYDHYAVQAFAQGALDYLLKPVDEARLSETVNRLEERLRSSKPAINTEQLLEQLSAQLAALRNEGTAAPLRWIRAQAGKIVRLIAIDDVDYLRSDAKYTLARGAMRGSPPRRSSGCRSRICSSSSIHSISPRCIARSS